MRTSSRRVFCAEGQRFSRRLGIEGLPCSGQYRCLPASPRQPLISNRQANIFLNAPVYSDEMAAMAEWFLESWTGNEKPKIA
jgi:hypothetical protein